MGIRLSKKGFLLLLVFVMAFLSLMLHFSMRPVQAAGPMVTVQYTESSDIIANPERGLYRQGGPCSEYAFNQVTLQNYRINDNITHVTCMYWLKDFTSSLISQAALDFFQQQMDTVRDAGLKVIVRFGYSEDTSGTDASISWISQHLDQLEPYLIANKDIIELVQAGFIGGWGEWAYSNHFGDTNNLTQQNWNDRKTVADMVLQTVPADRFVQLRLPKYKRTLYSSSALTSGEAYSGTAKARLGHHNDCFLASDDDWGTWIDPAVEYPYVAADTAYVPMGGETCHLETDENDNPTDRSSCTTALNELALFRYSFLNDSYHGDVINRFKSEGCYEEIQKKLGYRLVLQEGSYSASAAPGGEFTANITLENQGWAAPFNERNAELVLRHATDGTTHRIQLAADPRYWLAGQTVNINETVTLPPGMSPGDYEVLLNLPDSSASLYNRPEYAIRMANTNLWESNTGFNKLNHTVSISGSPSNTSYREAESFDAKSGNVIALTDSTVGASGNGYAGWTAAGDYLVFNGMDLTGKTAVEVRTASPHSDAQIEFRLGSATGTLLTTVDVPNTGGWAAPNGWATTAKTFTAVSGTYDVYAVFKRASGTEVSDLDWIQFTNSASLFREAESFDAKSGNVIALTDSTVGASGNGYAGWTAAGDYLVFNGMDLTGKTAVEVRTASPHSDAQIEFRLGSATGTLLTTVDVPNTGGWAAPNDWATTAKTFTAVSGTYDVYAVFKRASGTEVSDLDWIEFN
ncbi:DUF4832 domain-containing protein [Cohnella hongkongensis]|uniref:DUF4832 domain-containing protein n=1 Tax=Cohnella hongkongensis TaxID=178337 RepID=A0ABV9F6G6_9BACL